MRKRTAFGLLASATAVASIASAQQPQPTATGGVQPLPPPQTSQSVQPLPTIAPTTTAPPTATATATPTATATVPALPPTATATVPPPPPPPTATVTAPPPPPTATTTAPPPPPPPTATTTATAPPPPPPPTDKTKNPNRRADGEVDYLYATSAAFGVTMGAWIDTLGPCSPNNKDIAGKNVCDPGISLVAPLLLGAAFPLGFFLWDNFYPGGMHKGVPSSIGTGLIIGALEGLGVAGANYAIAGPETVIENGQPDHNRWGSDGIMTSIVVGSALGGIGGYAFGEAVRPDPRRIALVASGAGWGAMMGALFGGGAADSDSSSIGQGALVGNLVGINVGLATTGILAAVGYDPSWNALKYMWMGAGIGIVATSPIYLIYAATNSKDTNGNSLANHGMVANSFGMLAGIVIAGILTRDLKDPEPVADTGPTETQTTSPNGPNNPPPPGPTSRRPPRPWTPPFTVSFSPLPNGGGMFGVMGLW